MRSPELVSLDLLEPITADVTQRLNDRATAIRNLASRSRTDFAAYLGWVHETKWMLGSLLPQTTLGTLLRSPTYWAALAGTSGPANGLQEAIDTEIGDVAAVLEELAKHLARLEAVWSGVAKFVIADTSVYMTEVGITDRDWYRLTNTRRLTPMRLVVPMLVVDELDNLKDRGPERARPYARRNLKLFREAFAHGPQWRHTIDAPAGLEHWIVDMTLLTEPLEYRRLDHADSELIRQALWLQRASGRDVALVSRDTGQVFRAQAQGLTAHHLED